MGKGVNIIIKIALCLIMAMIVFPLFEFQAYGFGVETDMRSHVNRIMPIVNGEYYLPHSMLHYLVYWISCTCEYLSIKTSLLDVMIHAELVLFMIIVALIYKVLKFYLKDKYHDLVLLVIAFSLMFVTAIYAPFFNRSFYLGQWSPNIWHNPTTFIIKPIAIACLVGIFLFIQGYEYAKRTKFVVLLAILFTLSIWAKPSFAISFYPALFFYVLLFHTKEFKLYIQVFLILLPSVVFLMFQFWKTYYMPIEATSDLKDNIIFTFFGVTQLYTSNVFVSLLLAIAFPLSVLLTDYKNVRNNRILILSWFNVVIAYLQASFLAEKLKFDQAAFAFGYNLALHLLFIFSLIHYLNYRTNTSERKGQVLESFVLIVFFLHLMSGIAYYFHFLLTKNFE